MDASSTSPKGSNSMASGTLWNLGAFAVLAVTGVLLNIFIGGWAGQRALGVFNQTYAVFVIASQVTVLGLHQSALTHTARDESRDDRRAIAWSALALGLLTGLLGAGVLSLLAPWIGALLDSPETGQAVFLAAPGLLFLCLNKVQFGLANGRRDMRAFAMGQAARYLLMLAAALIWWGLDGETGLLGLIFTLPETLVLLLFAPWSIRRLGRGPLPGARVWLSRHLSFALRASANGLLSEMNVRVDILMLGLFLGDAEVGLYSMAAMLAEGFFSVLVVGRNQVAPVVARHLALDQIAEIQALFRKAGPITWAGAAGLALLVIGGYPVMLWLFLPGQGYDAAWPLLMVLIGGMAVYGGLLPFDTIVMQAGYPGWQSLQMTANVAVNVVLNALFIPQFGLMGAAVASALAYALAGPILLAIVRGRLGFSLVSPPRG